MNNKDLEMKLKLKKMYSLKVKMDRAGTGDKLKKWSMEQPLKSHWKKTKKKMR